MAKIGDILKQPEPGWKRFDDTTPLFLTKGQTGIYFQGA